MAVPKQYHSYSLSMIGAFQSAAEYSDRKVRSFSDVSYCDERRTKERLYSYPYSNSQKLYYYYYIINLFTVGKHTIATAKANLRRVSNKVKRH